MEQLPTKIWQAIGRTGDPPTSRWGKAMLDGPAAIEALQAEIDREHKEADVPNSVSRAFEAVAPLMVEIDRIERYIRDTGALELRQVLVPVPTPETAAKLAEMEYRLEPEETALLVSLLEAEAGLAKRAAESAMLVGYTLVADGAHFREGLKRFHGMRKPRAAERASFAFDGGFLSVDALGSVFAARATGAWPGVATCAAAIVPALAIAPPSGVQVSLRYFDGRLRVGTLTVDAAWMPVSGELLAFPAAPDWVEALSLKFRMDRARLLQSGRMAEVAAAEKKLAGAIAKAAKSLAPLGVPETDIRTLVERVLVDRWAAQDSKSQKPPL